jgi:hypothetical protein
MRWCELRKCQCLQHRVIQNIFKLVFHAWREIASEHSWQFYNPAYLSMEMAAINVLTFFFNVDLHLMTLVNPTFIVVDAVGSYSKWIKLFHFICWYDCLLAYLFIPIRCVYSIAVCLSSYDTGLVIWRYLVWFPTQDMKFPWSRSSFTFTQDEPTCYSLCNNYWEPCLLMLWCPWFCYQEVHSACKILSQGENDCKHGKRMLIVCLLSLFNVLIVSMHFCVLHSIQYKVLVCHVQTLCLSSTLTLCDCPGLVMPSFVSTKADMVVNGILPVDQMRDYVPPVSLISFLTSYMKYQW